MKTNLTDLTYPYPNFTDGMGPFVYANDITGGLFGLIIVVVLGLIMYVITSHLGFKRAGLLTLFLLLVLSVILVAMEILTLSTLMFVFVALIGLLLYTVIKG